MAFNFRVVFTGICTLVRATDDKSMVALLADGRHAETSQDRLQLGLDGFPLDRHVGFLRFDLGSTLGAGPLEGQGLWYPNGHRITFDVSGGHTDLRFVDIANVADLAKVAPGFETVDPQALGTNPYSKSAQVLAQVVIGSGEVKQEVTNPIGTQWTFHDHLGGDVRPVELANRVVVDMGEVTNVKVNAQKITTSTPPSPDTLMEFDESTTSGSVTLLVANLCETDPLLWGRKKRQARDDNDFRWHYELLRDQYEIMRELRRENLPYPVPEDAFWQPSVKADFLREIDDLPSELGAFVRNLDGEVLAKKLRFFAAKTRGEGEAGLGNNCYPGFAGRADLSLITSGTKAATPVQPTQGTLRAMEPWLGSIRADDLKSLTTELATFSRFTWLPGYSKSIDWVRSRLSDLGGAPSGLHSFSEDGKTANSIEVIYGQGSDPVIVVSAHLDAINRQDPQSEGARGANDNASGVAGLIAIKKVLDAILAKGGSLSSEIRLLFFGGEEQDLRGSYAYRETLISANVFNRISAVLNLDMIALKEGDGETKSAIVYGSTDLGAVLKDLGTTHCGLSKVDVRVSGYDSDHRSFEPRPAVSSTHEGEDPMRHKADDIVDSRLDFDLAAAITKMNLAYLLENAFRELPDPPA